MTDAAWFASAPTQAAFAKYDDDAWLRDMVGSWRFRELVHRELYRREARAPQLVDLGGEA